MDLFKLVGRLSIEGVDKANNDILNVTDTAQKSSGVFKSTFGKVAGAVAGAFATHKIIGFGKDVIATTQTFSDAMLKVQSLSGASGKELQKLNDTALKYGSTTAFTSSQVADAMGYMALAGFDTNQIMDSLSGTLGLASASGTDLATASDILTDALTAFGYSAKDAGLFADVMATTQAKSNTTVEALGEAFKYVAPIAGSCGYSIESVSTALGLMANAGVKGSMAGTSLSSIITRLSTNTHGARDAISKLGIEFYNSDGTARDLGDVLMDLSDKTKNMTVEQKANIAKTVAGQEAQKGLLAILNQGSGAYKNLKNTLLECDGTSMDMSKNMESGIGGAIRTIQSAIEGFKIKLGQKFEPYITNALQDLAKFVNDDLTPKMEGVVNTIANVMSWFEKHKKTVELCTDALKILILTYAGFKIGQNIQGFINGFQRARVALSLYKLETEGASIVQGLLNGQLTIGQTVVGLLTGKIKLAELATGLWAKGQMVLNAVLTANPIGVIVMAIAGLIAIVVIAYNKCDWFRDGVNKLWNTIKNFFANLPQNAKKAFDSFISFMQNLPEKTGYLIGLVIGKIARFVVDLGKSGVKAGSDFVNGIINFFTNLPSNLWNLLVSAYNGAVQFGSDMINKAIQIGQEFPSRLLGWFRSLPNSIYNIGGDVVRGLWNGITGGYNWLKDKVTGFCKGIIDGFKKGFDTHSPSRITTWIGQMLTQGIGVGVETDDSAEKSIKNKVLSVIDSAKSGLSNMSVSSNIDGLMGNNPMTQYQLSINGQIGGLNNSIDRLTNLIASYLPQIAENSDKPIAIDGNSLAVGMRRQMDYQLGRLSVGKGRGNV